MWTVMASPTCWSAFPLVTERRERLIYGLLRHQAEPLTLTTSTLGQGSPGDEFGAAVVLADLNEDGCSDIIVGAPGASGGAGRVYVVLGAPDGFQKADGQTLDGGATSGDRFGSSLAIARNLVRYRL